MDILFSLLQVHFTMRQIEKMFQERLSESRFLKYRPREAEWRKQPERPFVAANLAIFHYKRNKIFILLRWEGSRVLYHKSPLLSRKIYFTFASVWIKIEIHTLEKDLEVFLWLSDESVCLPAAATPQA